MRFYGIDLLNKLSNPEISDAIVAPHKLNNLPIILYVIPLQTCMLIAAVMIAVMKPWKKNNNQTTE